MTIDGAARRCPAVAEIGHRCLLVRHGGDVRHCTIGSGGWLFWGSGKELPIPDVARQRISLLSDAETGELLNRIERIEHDDADYWARDAEDAASDRSPED